MSSRLLIPGFLLFMLVGCGGDSTDNYVTTAFSTEPAAFPVPSGSPTPAATLQAEIANLPPTAVTWTLEISSFPERQVDTRVGPLPRVVSYTVPNVPPGSKVVKLTVYNADVQVIASQELQVDLLSGRSTVLVFLATSR